MSQLVQVVVLHSSPGHSILPFWILGGLTGLPSAISSFFAPDERIVDGVVIRVKKDEGFLEGCLFPLIFSFLFAPFFVLVSLFKNSVLLYNGRAKIEGLEQELSNVKDFLETESIKEKH